MFTQSMRGLLFAAALATSLYAVDGVVLIDQRAAMAGKVTPQDTAGFPVLITQPGSYRLTSNLEVPDVATGAIQIAANDVTLDLNGFTISGPNTCTPNPVRCTYSGSGIGIMAVGPVNVPSPSNVRVFNGTVRGMGGHGIRMMGDGTVVEKVNSTNNGGPGIVVGEGSVIDSVAKLNGSGAALVGLIVRNCVSNNNVFGIFVRPGGVAIGNTAIGNAATGISINNASASGNTAMNNGSYGFDATCPSSLTGNTSVGNTTANYNAPGACALANNAQ